MLDFETDLLCRDDDCDRLDVHYKHAVPKRAVETPKGLLTPAWEQDDPEGLAEAVIRACASYPSHYAAIARDVREDYGQCTDRTVYRHLAKLVKRGQLIKLDLGLACATYAQPKSRMLKDRAALREYMLSVV